MTGNRELYTGATTTGASRSPLPGCGFDSDFTVSALRPSMQLITTNRSMSLRKTGSSGIGASVTGMRLGIVRCVVETRAFGDRIIVGDAGFAAVGSEWRTASCLPPCQVTCQHNSGSATQSSINSTAFIDKRPPTIVTMSVNYSLCQCCHDHKLYLVSCSGRPGRDWRWHRRR